jgi:hypothetical protein
MQEIANRSKLLILCEAVQQAADATAEAIKTPTVFKQSRQKLLNQKLLELTKQYQQDAMQEISSELDAFVRQKQQEGKEPKRYKNEEADSQVTEYP